MSKMLPANSTSTMPSLAYESAKASVIMSQADLDQALMELDYTVVRSPIAG